MAGAEGKRRAEKGITAVGTRKAGKGVRAKHLQGGWSRRRSGRAEMRRQEQLGMGWCGGKRWGKRLRW